MRHDIQDRGPVATSLRRTSPRPLRLAALCAAALLALPAAAAAEPEQQRPQGPEKPAAAANSRLKVEVKIARAVDNRLPVDAGERFTPGKLYLWSEVRGGRGDFQIHHRWIRNGKTVFETPIDVSGPRWRTWSYLKARPGQWKVEVTDEGGGVLKTAEFVVQPDTQVSSAKDPTRQPSKQ